MDHHGNIAVITSVSVTYTIGATASITGTVFPTIDTVDDYINADTVSLGVSVNGNGGAVTIATTEDGSEHTGVSVSLGTGTGVSLDAAISIGGNVLSSNY